MFPNFNPFHFDPPIYPVEDVGDDWHRLCDLMARNPLVNRAVCPDWFDLTLTPASAGWRVALVFPMPIPCPLCRGQTVQRGVSCMSCYGTGVRRDLEFHTDSRDRAVNLVVRHHIAESLALVRADDRFAG